MPGVEILAMEEVISAYEWSWSAYLVTVAGFAIIFGLIGLLRNNAEFQDFLVGLMVGIIIGLPIGILPASLTVPSEHETHYKVTISDEVSMNDFLERYEILDQEGKIYTVREVGVEDGE